MPLWTAGATPSLNPALQTTEVVHGVSRSSGKRWDQCPGEHIGKGPDHSDVIVPREAVTRIRNGCRADAHGAVFPGHGRAAWLSGWAPSVSYASRPTRVPARQRMRNPDNSISPADTRRRASQGRFTTYIVVTLSKLPERIPSL